MIPAGWYDDPERPGSLRYWDGTGWAEPTTPGWKDVGDSLLWWDGQRYTARAAWDGSAWQLYLPDGTRSTTPAVFDPRRDQAPPPRPRGRRPPRSSRTARVSMIGLVATGCLVFIWWSVASEAKRCPATTQRMYSDHGATRLSWLVLVALAASNGIEGSVFVFTEPGISGALATDDVDMAAARRFLEAFLASRQS